MQRAEDALWNGEAGAGGISWVDRSRMGPLRGVIEGYQARVNPQAQGHFMCDDGRLGYGYVNRIERFLRPMVRRGAERLTHGNEHGH